MSFTKELVLCLEDNAAEEVHRDQQIINDETGINETVDPVQALCR